MRIFRIILIVIFSSLCAYASGNTKEKQFICGILLLNSKPAMKDSIKHLRYAELEKVTGVSGNEAISFIERYREKPEEWQKIETSILKLLENKDTVSIKK
jgi:hypothetical protein